MGLSQLANYLMVLALVQLGWFNSNVASGIVLLELTAVLLLLLLASKESMDFSSVAMVSSRESILVSDTGCYTVHTQLIQKVRTK